MCQPPSQQNLCIAVYCAAAEALELIYALPAPQTVVMRDWPHASGHAAAACAGHNNGTELSVNIWWTYLWVSRCRLCVFSATQRTETAGIAPLFYVNRFMAVCYCRHMKDLCERKIRLEKATGKPLPGAPHSLALTATAATAAANNVRDAENNDGCCGESQTQCTAEAAEYMAEHAQQQQHREVQPSTIRSA